MKCWRKHAMAGRRFVYKIVVYITTPLKTNFSPHIQNNNCLHRREIIWITRNHLRVAPSGDPVDISESQYTYGLWYLNTVMYSSAQTEKSKIIRKEEFLSHIVTERSHRWDGKAARSTTLGVNSSIVENSKTSAACSSICTLHDEYSQDWYSWKR